MPNSMQGTHRKASKCIELGIQALKHDGLNPKMEKPKVLRANFTEG
ncbi:hypothetical protein [Vibrio coralliirubri]|nr:hypothetical protein [Vibrio coralliirubri]